MSFLKIHDDLSSGIRIFFSSFDTEATFDFVTVYAGHIAKPARAVTNITGSFRNLLVDVRDTTALVVFRSGRYTKIYIRVIC